MKSHARVVVISGGIGGCSALIGSRLEVALLGQRYNALACESYPTWLRNRVRN